MADQKISDLASLTGASVATDDFTVIVDKSDTSMAATGTDKQITFDEIAKALSRATFGYSLGADAASRGSSASLASTYDRAMFADGNNALLTSGTLGMVRIMLPKGLSISNITFWSSTTALASATNQWFALFDSSRNKLAITGDDTSTAWAANTAKTLAITGGPFVTTYAGWHYLGIMVKATTTPGLVGPTLLGVSNVRAAAPIPTGTSNTGLTNPASCPSTAAALTAAQPMTYAEVS